MTTQVQNEKNRKNRKGLIGLAAAATAGALVLGLGWAYFSDTLTATADATAGTLDIEMAEGLEVSQNGGAPVAATGGITNLNPGDVLTITGTVTNDGTKSAWVRELVDVTTDAGMGKYVYVYPDAAPDQATLLGTDLGALTGTAVGDDNTLTDVGGTAAVLQGSEEADGDASVPVNLTIYFAKEAGNEAQGDGIDVTVDVQAIQYRNNTAQPDDNDWASVVTEAFDLG